MTDGRAELNNLPPPHPSHTNPRTQKKAELVARQIVDRIVTDDLRGGDRLEHEAELVEQLGVSRATLREAFRLLEVAGILQLRPGRDGGAMVQQATGEDFARMVTLFFQVTRCTYRDLLRAAIVTMPAIYAHVALEANDEDKARIRALWEDTPERPRSDASDVQRFTDQPLVVAASSRNPAIVLLVSAIATVFQRHMDRFLVGIPQRREGARVAHRLVEAIVMGDDARTARLIRANLEGWLEIAEREYPQILDAVVSWDD
jgi:DNA-binding FadR family transcriptional regulator